MTVEEAKALVLARFPAASVTTVRVGSDMTDTRRTLHTVIGGTRYMGPWLSGRHRSEAAAWLAAAKTVKRLKSQEHS